MWQFNVAVPVELHRKMRLRAADEDITLGDQSIRAIETNL